MILNERIRPDVATNLRVIETANEQVKRSQRMLVDIQGLVYERGTRDVINTWAAAFINDNLNAWGNLIKRSLKRDLVENLRLAAQSIITTNRLEISARAQEIQRMEGGIITEQKRRTAYPVIQRMKLKEIAFVNTFEDANVGALQYRALVQLVESQYLDAKTLVNYGFNL